MEKVEQSDVSGRFLGMPAVLLAKQVAGDPLGVLAKDLMVDVFEQVKLDRLGRPVHRFDAVDHDAAAALHEVAVKEGNGRPQPGIQLGLPLVPIVPVEIANGTEVTEIAAE